MFWILVIVGIFIYLNRDTIKKDYYQHKIQDIASETDRELYYLKLMDQMNRQNKRY